MIPLSRSSTTTKPGQTTNPNKENLCKICTQNQIPLNSSEELESPKPFGKILSFSKNITLRRRPLQCINNGDGKQEKEKLENIEQIPLSIMISQPTTVTEKENPPETKPEKPRPGVPNNKKRKISIPT